MHEEVQPCKSMFLSVMWDNILIRIETNNSQCLEDVRAVKLLLAIK